MFNFTNCKTYSIIFLFAAIPFKKVARIQMAEARAWIRKYFKEALEFGGTFHSKSNEIKKQY